MKNKTAAELRRFGLFMATAIGIISAILFWRNVFLAPVFLAVAIALLSLAYLAPVRLRGIEQIWMAVAEKIGLVVSTMLLASVFFIVMLPIAIILRILGKDLLRLCFDKRASSYWEKIEADGPHSRPYLPY